jgi:prepilin-type processing-associated H-X9-DG protein
MSPAPIHEPNSGPPFDPAATPAAVLLKALRTSLLLTWPGGEQAEISAERLRASCRCAWCTRARIDGSFAPSCEAITIASLTPVGGYAINIAFSDGHARGIYPWPYLRALAREGDGAAMTVAANALPGAPFHDGSPA